MQLTFVRPYISISSLTADALEPFSAITGLNGSGKTHLFHAIVGGHIQIDNITPSEIVYFNYGDFSVDPNYTAIRAADKAKHDVSSKKLTELRKLHNDRVKSVRQALLPELDVFESSLIGHLNSPLFCNDLLDTAKWADSEILADEMTPIGGLVTQLKAEDPDAVINVDVVRQKCDSLGDKARAKFELLYPGYYEFIAGPNGEPAGIFASQFERADFFAFDIAVQVRQYIYNQYVNDLNELRSNRGEQVSFLSPEQFLKQHGPPPLKILNDVLEEFDCNGYRFASPTYYPTLGQKVTDAHVPLHLIHEAGGYSTTIDKLSSGEQTLLALALAVYKAKKSRLCRVLLLDEVDTALHPSMTNQMLDVLNGVFVQQQGMKVIMATHSPSTVALVPDASVFLLKRDKEVTLRKSNKCEAIEFLTEGFATLDGSLKLMSRLSSDKVYIFSEGDNVALIEKANEFFGDNRIEVVKGIESVSGKSQLRTLFEFFCRTEHKSTVFFVWDCDVNEYRSLAVQNGTHPHVFPKNVSNNKVTCGIENLFPEPAFGEDFYDSKPKKDGGMHSSLNKRRFTDFMIANGTESDFAEFKPLFDAIRFATNSASASNEAAPTVA